MATTGPPTRLNQISVIYARGSYRTVGYIVGRTMKSSIEDSLQKSSDVVDPALAVYNSPEGKILYDKYLDLCRKKFPGYVQELEGMSEGCGVPFHLLFLLHIDTLIIPESDKFKLDAKEEGTRGCTSVMTNLENMALLGHTEDGPFSQLNNVFILQAEILDEDTELKTIEKFSTLCYAGYVAGGTMGYNMHGLIHSVNSLGPGQTFSNKTPILFLARALLGASNPKEVADILRDSGTGCSDGLSINCIFVKKGGPTIVQNIEMGPFPDPTITESEINIFKVPPSDSYVHCNQILRLHLLESDKDITLSSVNRHKATEKYAKPYNAKTIRTILSDQSNDEFPIYRNDMEKPYMTLVTGLFNVWDMTWSIYTGPSSNSAPIVRLNLELE